MRRHSFLIQVHPGEVSMLENLRTRERVAIDDLGAVGGQIERWVSEALARHGGTGGSGERSGTEGTAGRGEGAGSADVGMPRHGRS